MSLVEHLLPAKKICVYSVAAESSGALSVMNDFYREACQHPVIQFVFMVSTPKLAETDNIEVVRFPWIKKSWFHRLYFEWFVAGKLVQKYGCDKVFSLTNTAIPCLQIPQVIYLHQSLPFSDYKFRFSENRALWVYQNIISRLIYHGLKVSHKVIVQTKWLKDACVKKCKLDADKIVVEHPTLGDVKFYNYSDVSHHEKVFFYPAISQLHKNHWVVLKACKLLNNKGIKDYKVIFTFRGNENSLAVELKNFADRNELPVDFRGAIPRDEVMQMYAKSTLLFPSKIESFGMPLLEARKSNTPVIAGDTLFAREILDGYEDAKFFDVDDAVELAKAMEMSI